MTGVLRVHRWRDLPKASWKRSGPIKIHTQRKTRLFPHKQSLDPTSLGTNPILLQVSIVDLLEGAGTIMFGFSCWHSDLHHPEGRSTVISSDTDGGLGSLHAAIDCLPPH